MLYRTKSEFANKHYYMGSQRIASNMISADFDHEAPLLEPIQAPEGRYGYTNAEAAIVDDILSTLRCLTGDEELAFDLGDFLYLPSIGEGITFTDDEGADLAAEELPTWLACSQSLYWAIVANNNYTVKEYIYFWSAAEIPCAALAESRDYHSDYLGSVEFVTDMRGEAYQLARTAKLGGFFLNTPWGDQPFGNKPVACFREGAWLPRWQENQLARTAKLGGFARNYTAFSSRFRFNPPPQSRFRASGKEWEGQALRNRPVAYFSAGARLPRWRGNFYYGARYYDPKISVWLSVDPKAYAFPGVSPYSSLMNNPIMMIDPGGDSTFIFNKAMEFLGMVPDQLENAVIIADQDAIEGINVILENVERSKDNPDKIDQLGQSAREHSESTYILGDEYNADGIPIDVWLALEGRDPLAEYGSNALKSIGLGSANTIIRGPKPNPWALVVAVILSGCVTGHNQISDYYNAMSPEEKERRKKKTKEFVARHHPEGYSE